MTKEQTKIAIAAKIIKISRLALMPGMDEIAVRLNCSPNHDEVVEAELWFKAFDLAKGGHDAIEFVFDALRETGQFEDK